VRVPIPNDLSNHEPLMPIDSSEFAILQGLVSKHAAIVLDTGKEYLAESRLTRWLVQPVVPRSRNCCVVCMMIRDRPW